MTRHRAWGSGARWFLLVIATLVCCGEATPTPTIPSPTVFLLGPNIDPDYMAIVNGVTWVADSNLDNHTIYKIDASQRFVLVPMPSGLSGGEFAVAKDGALWMVAAQPGTLLPVYPPRTVGEGPAQIVRFDADGTMHAFKTEYNYIQAIAMGPDDRPWFESGDGDGVVAEIAPDGTVRRLAVAKGVRADGRIWVWIDEAMFRDDPDVEYPPSRIVVFKPGD